MKLFACYKVKTIRVNGVSQKVEYDRVENLSERFAHNTDHFPNGQQLEDNGIAFFWGCEEMKEA